MRYQNSPWRYQLNAMMTAYRAMRCFEVCRQSVAGNVGKLVATEIDATRRPVCA